MTARRPTQRRARSPDAKDARRTALLEAARAALERTAYDAIKIEHVAAAAGLAKGTTYLYFASKETLFLAVLSRELANWLALLETEVRKPRADPASTIPRLLARTLAARPQLVQLLTLLHGRLEANAPDAEIRAFKLFLVERLGRLGEALELALGLERGRGVHLMLRTHILTIGLGPIADPPRSVSRVIDSDPAFSQYRIDFTAELTACLRDMLKGWKANDARRRRGSR